jgi:hypothetical protein
MERHAGTLTLALLCGLLASAVPDGPPAAECPVRAARSGALKTRSAWTSSASRRRRVRPSARSARQRSRLSKLPGLRRRRLHRRGPSGVRQIRHAPPARPVWRPPRPCVGACDPGEPRVPIDADCRKGFSCEGGLRAPTYDRRPSPLFCPAAGHALGRGRPPVWGTLRRRRSVRRRPAPMPKTCGTDAKGTYDAARRRRLS